MYVLEQRKEETGRKTHQFFSNYLSLWRHLNTIMFRLFGVLEKVMQDFSNRQSWHFLLVECESPTIDQ